MGRRLSLPLTDDARQRPTADAIRKKLGGRASTEPLAGEVVAFTTGEGAGHVGVVLFARGEHVDVWIDRGFVRRTRRSGVEKVRSPIPGELADVAGAARVFAGLMEGQRVGYHHDAGLGEGTLVEKCRFGALLERDDGVLIGVGFRRIRPLRGGGPGPT